MARHRHCSHDTDRPTARRGRSSRRAPSTLRGSYPVRALQAAIRSGGSSRASRSHSRSDKPSSSRQDRATAHLHEPYPKPDVRETTRGRQATSRRESRASHSENGGGAWKTIGEAFEFELERRPDVRPSRPSPSGPSASAQPTEPDTTDCTIFPPT
ncbi:hypothetical protein Q1695_014211 [Nippostrongylus brasiliensis]|nr:hypothetical protein Q1695_014211 [Nippostrongylus brasiliensis]